jgi:hypothetical protein
LAAPTSSPFSQNTARGIPQNELHTIRLLDDDAHPS